MKKLLVTLLLFFFPVLALAAEGSLSFAPPASDYSVVFLGNMFGIVDGVLNGNGSQIMGVMFAVFNSAVLALGGVIIMYTLMVSTMNTAHEGQMLGQKWSSIWIPVRSTIGLALLIPKASGYCMMQIFVMWVVVQGVGAADKIWEAALGYLNRGGVIIQAQQSNPTANLTNPNDTAAVPTGALSILTGQVCMLGLQKQLEMKRQANLSGASKPGSTSPCAGKPTQANLILCGNSVPDFIGSVNVVAVQNEAMQVGIPCTFSPGQGIPGITIPGMRCPPNNFSVNMPNFPSSSPYAFLNGVCGKITWLPIANLSSTSAINGISASQNETITMSRAIAIQQMYMDLSAVAQVMVTNNPQSTSQTGTTNNNCTNIANQSFGIPLTTAGAACNTYKDTCVGWGPGSSTSSCNKTGGSGALFNGTEFQGAISDYNGVMAPTLNLLSQSAQSSNANDARAFIAKATSQGWILAGAYFFDLVKLNGNAADSTLKTDTNTGLDGSTGGFMPWSSTKATSPPCATKYDFLCQWFGLSTTPYPTPPTPLDWVQGLIDGTFSQSLGGIAFKGQPLPAPSLKSTDIQGSSYSSVQTQQLSSVYGFIQNSMLIQLPGQPGLAPLQFANMMHFNLDTAGFALPEGNFDCGGVKILFFTFCLGRMMGNLFYNAIFRWIYNTLLTVFQQIVQQVIMTFLMIPLTGMAAIFQQGLSTINAPGVNPVVALANMGVMYINFASNLWMMLLNLAIITVILPLFGIFVFALIALSMPLLLAWIGTMVTIGFTTAYYIPLLPYMIFTFGTLAWLISVIEAMVAAPIVALGVTHPEGHDAFGKGEAAVMLLMNVFLRPAMMIIGYISAIALCYVGVWIMNAGFDHAIGFIQSPGNAGSNWAISSYAQVSSNPSPSDILGSQMASGGGGSGTGGYKDWAGIYAYFFSVLIYTTMYLVIVQQAFSLITLLPDKVLRWIGGTPESIGQESAKWGEEIKSKAGEGAKATQDSQGQIAGKLGGYAGKAAGGAKFGSQGDVSASGE